MKVPKIPIIIIPLIFISPLLLGGYWMDIGFQILSLAAFGLCWHLMGGYAGLLSMGHTAFAGIASYVLAIAMMSNFSTSIAIILGLLCSCLLGLMIASLCGRFAIAGVYFMLLTISMNEMLRILVENLEIAGGNAGAFMPREYQLSPEASYVLVALLAVLITVVTKSLLKSKLGYQARAMAADPVAAESIGINTFIVRLKMTMMSAFLAGSVGILQFYYHQNLFPDHVFSLSKSLDILMVCMIGGLGSLYSPWVGALILIPLSEGIVCVTDLFNLQSSAIKPIINAVMLIVIMVKIPSGLIPMLQRKGWVKP